MCMPMRPEQQGRWGSRALRALALMWGGGAWVLLSPAAALPAAGAQVPSLEAKDLLGQPHESREWQGHPTMLVVMTEQHAGDEVRRWFDTAATRIPEAIHRASLISLDLPF